MKAAEFDRYGGSEVLEVREAPDPRPRAGEVLVRVRAASVNPKDILTRQGKFRLFSGLTLPKRPGYDWAGEAVEVGNAVRGVRPGDRLFGMIQPWRAGGACAELLRVDPGECATIPGGLGFEEAAAVPLAGLTAWQALAQIAALAPGDELLINGASGGVGVFAVQIAASLGARVTTLSGPSNLAFCASLGAHRALDYSRDRPLDEPGRFRVIFDVFGNLSLDRCRKSLAEGGLYISTIPTPRLLADAARTALSSKRARLIVVRSRRPDLEQLARLIEQGALRPVIDSSFDLRDIRSAHDRVATKHARGKVVVRV